MVRQQRQPNQRRPPDNDGWEPPQEPDEPLDGLVPLGGGFYATNDEPVSPYDCVRWPDSPFCGGNPFTRDLFDFGLTRVQDECNIGIQLAPSFGFIKLPIHQFVYRKPGECRLPPPPPTPPVNQAPACSPIKIQGNIDNKSLAIAYRDTYFEYREFAPPFWELAQTYVDITRVTFNDKGYFATVVFRVRWSYINTLRDIDKERIDYVEYGVLTTYPIFTFRKLDEDVNTSDVLCEAALGIEFTNLLIKKTQNHLDWVMCFEKYSPAFWSVYDFLLPVPGEPPDVEYDTPIRSFSVPPNPPSGGFYGIQWTYNWESLWIINKQTTIKTFETNFDYLPPPPPDDCECMCKCNNDSNNDQLLRLILKRIGAFPVSQPVTMLTKNGQQPSATKSIKSLLEMMEWITERMDELIGEFEITVEIKDTDLTKAGDQSQTIRLPNMAEAVGEMYSLLIQNQVTNELILNITNRTLVESGQIKQQGFKDYRALLALIEYINFPHKEVVENMPLTFTPGQLTFDQMLKPIEQPVDVIDYQEKESFQNHLMTLLQAAAITRAVHYRRLDSDPTTAKNQLKDDLRHLLKNKDLIKELQEFANQVNKEYNQSDNKPD